MLLHPTRGRIYALPIGPTLTCGRSRAPSQGRYHHRTALTKQTLSKNRTTLGCSFGTTPRFGYVERNIKKTATPGPGAYVN